MNDIDNMNSLIWIKQNSLSKDFCDHLIRKFENDERKSEGRIGFDYRIDPDVKRSTDLMITAFDDWREEDKILYDEIQISVNEYREYCAGINQYLKICDDSTHLEDTGYQIQRTCPNQFYTWHNDAFFLPNAVRLLTFIWYLNDVKHEGQTEFLDGTKINPETGKLIVFPSTWTYLHRGVSPQKEVKYICTGWIYAKTGDGKLLD